MIGSRWLGLGLAALPLALAAVASWQSWRAEQDAAVAYVQLRASRLAAVVEIALGHALAAADVTAATISAGLERDDAATALEAGHNMARQLRDRMTAVGAITIVDPAAPPPPLAAAVAAHLSSAAPGDWTVGSAGDAGSEDRAAMVVSVTASGGDGRAAAVVAATVAPTLLDRAFGSLANDGDVRVLLRHASGAVFATHATAAPDNLDAVLRIARPVAGAPDRVAAAGEVALVASAPVADGAASVIVAQTVETAMQAWATQTATLVALSLAASAAIVVVWRRETAAARAALAAEARMRAAEAAAMQAERRTLIRGMAGGVAHHFNNLMTVVIGVGDMLADNPALPAAERTAGQDLVRVGLRGAQLSDALKLASASGYGRPRPVDLTEIARAAVARRSDAIGSERLSVVVEGPRSDAPAARALCDPRAVDAALDQILDNAVEAAQTVANGRVSVSAAAGGDGPRIVVEDNGPGMSDDVARRAREPFFTTKPTRVGGAAGLGLAIAEGLLAAADGALEIDSAPCAGARVTLRLPAADADAPASPAFLPDAA